MRYLEVDLALEKVDRVPGIWRLTGSLAQIEKWRHSSAATCVCAGRFPRADSRTLQVHVYKCTCTCIQVYKSDSRTLQVLMYIVHVHCALYMCIVQQDPAHAHVQVCKSNTRDCADVYL